MKSLASLFSIFAVYLILNLPTQAAHAESLRVPDELRQWVSWVQDKHPEWNCAKVEQKYSCIWPASLFYEVRDRGADFVLKVELLADGVVELPAGEGLRPQKISVYNSSSKLVAAPVELSKSGVHVALPKGTYSIQGTFFWKTLPSSLPLPQHTALVDVDTTKLGPEVQVERKKGKLWLGAKRGESSGVESLELYVSRQIVDGSPLTINTLLQLRVAGAARPLSLGSILPENAVPMSIQSSLQNVLSPEGELALQLRPGTFEIRIQSISPQPVDKIIFPKVTNPVWPKQEVISFKEDIGFRSVEIVGGTSVFPNATRLPADWRTGATYSVASGNVIDLKELSRGSVRQGKDTISLFREFWPHLDSNGYTVRDLLTGTARQSSRINALESLQLSRIVSGGQPVLVTKDLKTGQAGTELRNAVVNLQAVSRLETDSISATGWDTEIDNIHGTLHLPPSWKLIDIGGASEVSSSWLRSWTLLDLFFSFLVVVASYRLLSFKTALFVALAMILNHQEFLAPRMLFVYLLLLIAWYRAFAENSNSSFKIACRVLLFLTLLAFVFDGLAFAKLQFTQFLFPQLQSGTRYRSLIQELYVGIETEPLVWPSILLFLGFFVDWLRRMIQSDRWMKRIVITFVYGVVVVGALSLFSGFFFLGVGGSNYQGHHEAYSDLIVNSPSEVSFSDAVEGQEARVESYASLRPSKSSKVSSWGRGSAPKPKAEKVQSKALTSGLALPTWRWRQHNFSVLGPVSPDHQLNFVLLSGSFVRLLSALRVLVVLTLLLLIVKAVLRLPQLRSVNMRAAGKVALVALSLACFNQKAVAEIPHKAVLEELEQRLVNSQCQRKKCASIESLVFKLSEDKFSLELVALSEGTSAVLLPGPIDVLRANRGTMDGREYSGLRVTATSQLQLRTAPGRHRYEITGKIPDLGAFSVAVPEDILSVVVDAPDWQYEGVSDTGRVGDALRFTRKRVQSADIVTKTSDTFLPSWLLVERNITIAELTTVYTEVRRLGNTSRAVDFLVPLLPAEKVNSGDVKIENNSARVYFSAGVDRVVFSGSLPGAPKEWKIEAKPQAGLSEVWRVNCSEYQSCEVAGLRPTAYYQNNSAVWTWLPFPGEAISIKAKPLSAIAGGSITADSFREAVSWGARLQSLDIYSDLRVTKQSEVTLALPEDVRIKEIYLNGTPGAGLQLGSTARVLVSPGTHQLHVQAESDFDPKMVESMPAVKLNIGVSNLNFEVTPGLDRWVLWVGGLSWGPSVVFWAKLIVVTALCCGLFYFGLLPTSLVGTILLGIGLAGIPVIALGFPLLWLAAIHLLPSQMQRLRGIKPEVLIGGLLLLGAISLAIFYEIVKKGLILQPPMLIVGNNSTASTLRWYLDHSGPEIPQPWVFSLPMWCWRTFSLLWAMWLVLALISWLRMAIRNSKDLLSQKSEIV